MTSLFIDFRAIDFVDILLVTVLLFYLYKVLKDTVAFTIVLAIFTIFVLSVFVSALKMELLGSIFKEILSIGSVAIVVVFQKEIRSFLLSIGTRYQNPKKIIRNVLKNNSNQINRNRKLDPVVLACKDMSREHTGALIVLTNKVGLKDYYPSGVKLDAAISAELIKSIFFKNSPLHDGALIISHHKIAAARCVLPVSDNINISGKFGLRHRAAIGISEVTDAQIIIVSEETGAISHVKEGNIVHNTSPEGLQKLLNDEK